MIRNRLSKKLKTLNRYSTGTKIYIIYMFILLIGVSFLIYIYTFHEEYLSGVFAEVDSARYLLSAEAQAQAAILGIVISLTLIAIQLASQSYSSRIIEAFVKDKWLWLLLLLYCISIMYDLVILSLISNNFKYIQIFVVLSLILMTFSIGLLFPYIDSVTKKLLPGSIISSISNQIKREELLDEINNLTHSDFIMFKSFNEETSIRPILDIIKASIYNNDPVTAKYGINEIAKIAEDVFKYIYGPSETKKALSFFFGHIYEIWQTTLIKKDELTAIQVAICLKNIIKIDKETLNYIPSFYYKIFTKSLFDTSIKNNWDEFLEELIDIHIELADISVKYNLENSFNEVINALEQIGTETMRYGDRYIHYIFIINKKLGEFLENSVVKKWGPVSADILKYIQETSEFLIENAKSHTILASIFSGDWGRFMPLNNLESIAKILINNDFYNDHWWYKLFSFYLLREGPYYNIGKKYAQKIYGNPLFDIIKSLEEIGIHAIEHGYEEAVETVIKTLTDIAVVDLYEGGPNIDKFLQTFNVIKENSPDKLQKNIFKCVNSSVEELTEKVIDIVRSIKEDENSNILRYCNLLIEMGQYGYKNVIDQVLRNHAETSQYIRGYKKFEQLRDCYYEKSSGEPHFDA